MTGPSPFDENFNGVSDVFFDDILNFFDFPLEDVEENVGGGEYWDTNLQWLEPPPTLDVLPGFSSGKICDDASNAPFDKTSHPKKLPSATEATSSGSVLHSNTSDVKVEVKVSRLFQTSSPVSVLESSSSYSNENPTTCDVKFIPPVKRPRSKRSRPSTFRQRFTIPFISSTSSPPKRSHSSTTSESGSETYLTETVSNPVKRKQKKKKNLSVLSGATEVGNFSSEGLGATRKCMHCEVTKTPQWREGPMGPKTLCNACGVRYRSGRLFPEYRPASSPTFVASLHSNSHKKVIEMRNKASPRGRMVAMESLWSPLRGESTG